MALLELRPRMETPQTVPSGAVMVFASVIMRGRKVESADERRRKRLATGVAGVHAVPELN